MSGWQTFTVDANDEQAAKEIAQRFNELYEDDPDGDARTEGATVRGIEWGYSGGRDEMFHVLVAYPSLWETAVLMNCNDTSDSGSGTAYSAESGELEQIDSASGVERARGHDAASELEHHVDGHIEMR